MFYCGLEAGILNSRKSKDPLDKLSVLVFSVLDRAVLSSVVRIICLGTIQTSHKTLRLIDCLISLAVKSVI